jgi:hypothetical protein
MTGFQNHRNCWSVFCDNPDFTVSFERIRREILASNIGHRVIDYDNFCMNRWFFGCKYFHSKRFEHIDIFLILSDFLRTRDDYRDLHVRFNFFLQEFKNPIIIKCFSIDENIFFALFIRFSSFPRASSGAITRFGCERAIGSWAKSASKISERTWKIEASFHSQKNSRFVTKAECVIFAVMTT